MKVEHSLLKVRILREYRFHVPIHHFFIKFRDNLESSQKLKIHHLQPISSFAKIIGIDSGTAPAREILERACTCYAQCRKHTGQEVGREQRSGTCCFGKHRTHFAVGRSLCTIPSSFLTKIPRARNPVSLGRGHRLEKPKKKKNAEEILDSGKGEWLEEFKWPCDVRKKQRFKEWSGTHRAARMSKVKGHSLAGSPGAGKMNRPLLSSQC